jgi:hypothetical protein
VAALTLISASSPATAGEENTKLALGTDYLFQRVDIDTSASFAAHAISLTISLDNKGGKGVLGIDPNSSRFNAFGDQAGHTEIATRSLDVTLHALAIEDSGKKGRRLYEIKGAGLKRRLFLVLAREKTDAHRLLVADEDGTVTRVFPLCGVAKGK